MISTTSVLTAFVMSAEEMVTIVITAKNAVETMLRKQAMGKMINGC